MSTLFRDRAATKPNPFQSKRDYGMEIRELEFRIDRNNDSIHHYREIEARARNKVLSEHAFNTHNSRAKIWNVVKMLEWRTRPFWQRWFRQMPAEMRIIANADERVLKNRGVKNRKAKRRKKSDVSL